MTSTFTGWLYRPFIDLVPEAPPGNDLTLGLVLAINGLMENRDTPRLHGVLLPQMRREIVHASGQWDYRVEDVNEIASPLTREWETLIEALNERSALAERPQFVRALWVLHRLTLARAVLRWSSPFAKNDGSRYGERGTDEVMLIRGLAELSVSLDEAGLPALETLARVRHHAPKGSWAQVEATYTLAAVSAKYLGNLERTRDHVKAHAAAVSSATTRVQQHEYGKLWSRYHRVAAFVPQLRRDKEAMVAEMDRAEKMAGLMVRDYSESFAETQVIHTALYESRTKEALALGDRELALERAGLLTYRWAPTSPTSWSILGDVLVELERFEEALDAYRSAAHYGPQAEHAFMVGQCLAKLGDFNGAIDAFMEANRRAPAAREPLEELHLYALADPRLREWVLERLRKIPETPAPEPRAYQRSMV